MKEHRNIKRHSLGILRRPKCNFTDFPAVAFLRMKEHRNIKRHSLGILRRPKCNFTDFSAVTFLHMKEHGDIKRHSLRIQRRPKCNFKYILLFGLRCKVSELTNKLLSWKSETLTTIKVQGISFGMWRRVLWFRASSFESKILPLISD